MKLAVYFLSAMVCLTTLGCKDDTPVQGVDLVYREQFEIFAGLGVFDVHHFYIRNINTRYSSLLLQAGKLPEDIIQVITAEAGLSGQFGDANLGIIDRISVRVFSEDNPNNYLEIAYRDPSPADPGNTLPLIPSLADSKEFFSKERLSLDVVIWLRSNTLESIPVQFDFKMRATYE